MSTQPQIANKNAKNEKRYEGGRGYERDTHARGQRITLFGALFEDGIDLRNIPPSAVPCWLWSSNPSSLAILRA
jgi:hypothetical protein